MAWMYDDKTRKKIMREWVREGTDWIIAQV
jgi:hypothetical protein